MKDLFYNMDLQTEIEKHINADSMNVSKGEYFNGYEKTWCIDINEDSYFYYNEKEMNDDFIHLEVFNPLVII